MKIIEPSYEIISPIDRTYIMKHLEAIGRTCYRSEDKITDESSAPFIRGIIKSGHEAMIEHFSLSVRFTCDRGVSHELVRHRIASYAQSSTRYCNYSKDKFGNELTFIKPSEYSSWSEENKNTWTEAMKASENYYLKLINGKMSPQNARGVLPIDLMTEIVMTANLREFRSMLKLRCAKTAHPNIRFLMLSLLNELNEKLPDIFNDIWIMFNV